MKRSGGGSGVRLGLKGGRDIDKGKSSNSSEEGKVDDYPLSYLATEP